MLVVNVFHDVQLNEHYVGVDNAIQYVYMLIVIVLFRSREMVDHCVGGNPL